MNNLTASTCVVVLGVGRSGTSTVAGILFHLGVFMGERLMRADSNNPFGYFEDEEFVALHRLMIGGRPENYITPCLRYIHVYSSMYISLLRAREKKPLWGVKAPVLCFLFPYFLSHVEAKVKVIHVFRPQKEVVKSLQRVTGFPRRRAEVIYWRYRRALETSLQAFKGPLLTVSYPELLTDTREVVQRIADFIGQPFNAAAMDFIRPEARRFACSVWERFPSKSTGKLDKGTTPISNAEELLLICAQPQLDGDLKERGKEILQKKIDWDFFMETGGKSGLAYPIYNSLKTIDCPEYIPKYILDKLKMGYLYALPKTTVQYRETTELLKLFFEKKIPVIPLKGPMLSKGIYGDVAARGLSADIDLLVKEEHKGLARRLLEEKGYIFVPDPVVEEERLWQYMYGKPGSATVDLHWEINPASLNKERMKGFWKGARLQEEEGARFYEFREEELLLYLSVQFVDSAYLIQLRSLSDINVLLAKYKSVLDWAGITEKAKDWRLSNSLYASLYLCRTLFGSDIPDETLTNLKPGPIKRIFIRIFANKRIILHKDSFRRRFIRKFLWYILFQILEARSPKEYFAIFFPPKEKMGNRSYFKRLATAALRIAQTF